MGGGDPSPTQSSSLVDATIDESPVTWKSWMDGGSAYGGQSTIELSTLAVAEDVLVRVTHTEGVGVMENPPPRPIRGNPWQNFAHSPQPTSVLKGGYPQQKGRTTPAALGAGVGRTLRPAIGPPLNLRKFIYPHPRGGPLANILRGEPLEKLSPHSPLPRGAPRDQVRASAHPGHWPGQAPPPLLTHTSQKRGEPGAGFLQGPPGIPHPGGDPGITHLRPP